LFVLVALVGAVVALAFAAPASAAAGDNTGTDFWVGYATNFGGGATKTMFITGGTATTGTVSVPGLAFSQDYTVTPGTVTSVELPAGAEMPAGEGEANVGVHVTAADPVTVYGLSRIQFTTDAYLGLPVTALDSHYTVMAWGPGLGGVSEFAFTSPADGTQVTITPKVDTAGGHAAGTPYSVTLNQGQMYQVAAANAGDDLTGTILQASGPIAVFGGHQCANIPSTAFVACDHVIEQLMPDQSWGTSFLTVPLKTRLNGDTFKMMASQDGTTVQVNGAPVATLNAGEQTIQNIQGNSTITADKPIEVAQFSNSSSFDGVTSDPFMMLVPPFEQFQTGYTITTPATGFTNYMNLVVPNSEVDSILVDGQPLPAGTFTPIGSTDFSGAQVDIAQGSHTITGNGQPFGVFVYGFASFDSYGYPGGLSLAAVARVANISLSPQSEDVLVNTQACVDATVTDSNGNRVPNVRVDFNVTGANTTSGSVNADDNGVAHFCYTGTNLGGDTITATLGSLTATATKNWVSSLPTPSTTTTTTATTPAPPPATTPPATTARATVRAVVAGVPRACVSGSFSVRVRVGGTATSVRVRVLVDGRVVVRSTRKSFTVAVNAKRLRAGRHVVAVQVSGSGARSVTKRVSFRRCAPVRPTLTG